MGAIQPQERICTPEAFCKITLLTYWNIGRRIVEEEQQGNSRADYGKRLIPILADELTIKYGSRYNKRNLAYFRKFYLEFKDLGIFHTASGKYQLLSWSHIRYTVANIDMVTLQAPYASIRFHSTRLVSKRSIGTNIARYSMLKDNDRLFQAKYLTFLPTEEELKQEIEQQKEIFRLQHSSLGEKI